MPDSVRVLILFLGGLIVLAAGIGLLTWGLAPVLSAMLPLSLGIAAWCWWDRGYELRRERREGLCVACGYDLTGNVSGVCPECGTESRGA